MNRGSRPEWYYHADVSWQLVTLILGVFALGTVEEVVRHWPKRGRS